jgi:hypothetical protein
MSGGAICAFYPICNCLYKTELGVTWDAVVFAIKVASGEVAMVDTYWRPNSISVTATNLE